MARVGHDDVQRVERHGLALGARREAHVVRRGEHGHRARAQLGHERREVGRVERLRVPHVRVPHRVAVDGGVAALEARVQLAPVVDPLRDGVRALRRDRALEEVDRVPERGERERASASTARGSGAERSRALWQRAHAEALRAQAAALLAVRPDVLVDRLVDRHVHAEVRVEEERVGLGVGARVRSLVEQDLRRGRRRRGRHEARRGRGRRVRRVRRRVARAAVVLQAAPAGERGRREPLGLARGARRVQQRERPERRQARAQGRAPGSPRARRGREVDRAVRGWRRHAVIAASKTSRPMRHSNIRQHALVRRGR